MKTLIASISLLFLSTVLTISCNIIESGRECGPFDDKFKTIGFNAGLISLDVSESPTIDYHFITFDADTIRYDEFAISMVPIADYYSLNSDRNYAVSFIPAAVACSPPIPVSEEVITDIQIYVDSEDNIAAQFDIIVRYSRYPYQRMDLIEFLNSDPTVPDALFLVLKSAPDTSEPVQFTVQYSQNGFDMDTFEFTTRAVVITPPLSLSF